MKININDYEKQWIKRQKMDVFSNEFYIIYPNNEPDTQNGLEIMGINQLNDYIEIDKPSELTNWLHALENAYLIDGAISMGTCEMGELHDLHNINDTDVATKTVELLQLHIPQLSGDDSYFDYGYSFILEILETLIFIIDEM
jgi:hypothetical protein